jgi:hypothetical protein
MLPHAERARVEQERAERRKADREMLERSYVECSEAASQQSVRRKLMGNLQAVLHMGRRADDERTRVLEHIGVGRVHTDFEQGVAEHEEVEHGEAGPEETDEQAGHAKAEREETMQGQAEEEHQHNSMKLAQVKQHQHQQGKALPGGTKLVNTMVETSLQQVNTRCE